MCILCVLYVHFVCTTCVFCSCTWASRPLETLLRHIKLQYDIFNLTAMPPNVTHPNRQHVCSLVYLNPSFEWINTGAKTLKPSLHILCCLHVLTVQANMYVSFKNKTVNAAYAIQESYVSTTLVFMSVEIWKSVALAENPDRVTACISSVQAGSAQDDYGEWSAMQLFIRPSSMLSADA